MSAPLSGSLTPVSTRSCENGHAVESIYASSCPTCDSINIISQDDSPDLPAAPTSPPTKRQAIQAPQQSVLSQNQASVAPRRSHQAVAVGRARLRQLLLTGLGLAVVAGPVLVVGIEMPNDFAFWLGVLVAWASNFILIVAAIGYGTKFGSEAADA